MTSSANGVRWTSGQDRALASSPPVPSYLERDYWWAYVHPRAVRFFERPWLVNLILFGQYGRLRDTALSALCRGNKRLPGQTLQIACVYGNLTARLVQKLTAQARLDVVDILPVQLQNLRGKLPADERVHLHLQDATRLNAPDAQYDQILMFFLLHEQPRAVRRASLQEALRVLKPGGRLVIVDYHRPASLHPLRPLMHAIFRWLEPYAHDLWRHEIAHDLPDPAQWQCVEHTLSLGGLYQQLIITRPITKPT
jgi:ubiquinone/menaquinone biosynthesis C-methylase UbiE